MFRSWNQIFFSWKTRYSSRSGLFKGVIPVFIIPQSTCAHFSLVNNRLLPAPRRCPCSARAWRTDYTDLSGLTMFAYYFDLCTTFCRPSPKNLDPWACSSSIRLSGRTSAWVHPKCPDNETLGKSQFFSISSSAPDCTSDIWFGESPGRLLK